MLCVCLFVEICPRKSAFANDILVDGVHPVPDGILQTNHRLSSDDNTDSVSAMSSSSEGLRPVDDDQTNHDGYLMRNAVDERLEAAKNIAEVSDKERGDVVAGDDSWGSTEAAYKHHQKLSAVENAGGVQRPSVDGAVESVQEEHRPNLISADDGHPEAECIDHEHDAAVGLHDEESQHIYHSTGDATDNHDLALLHQPSTARSKTSEYVSYGEDFTEMSDDRATHSATDSRLAELLPLLLRTFGDNLCEVFTLDSIIVAHTHLFNGILYGMTWVSRHQKGKMFWILMKQELIAVNRPDALLDAKPTVLNKALKGSQETL